MNIQKGSIKNATNVLREKKQKNEALTIKGISKRFKYIVSFLLIFLVCFNNFQVAEAADKRESVYIFIDLLNDYYDYYDDYSGSEKDDCLYYYFMEKGSNKCTGMSLLDIKSYAEENPNVDIIFGSDCGTSHEHVCDMIVYPYYEGEGEGEVEVVLHRVCLDCQKVLDKEYSYGFIASNSEKPELGNCIKYLFGLSNEPCYLYRDSSITDNYYEMKPTVKGNAIYENHIANGVVSSNYDDVISYLENKNVGKVFNASMLSDVTTDYSGNVPKLVIPDLSSYVDDNQEEIIIEDEEVPEGLIEERESDGVKYTYDVKANKLTIYPDKDADKSVRGHMENYSQKSLAPWDSYKTKIKSVEIKDGMKYVGQKAFYGMTNLEKVSIADSVTTIGAYAFQDCDKLTSVKLPNSLNKIYKEVFYKCDNLEMVEFPDNYIWIENHLFSRCEKEINIKCANNSFGHLYQKCEKNNYKNDKLLFKSNSKKSTTSTTGNFDTYDENGRKVGIGEWKYDILKHSLTFTYDGYMKKDEQSKDWSNFKPLADKIEFKGKPQSLTNYFAAGFYRLNKITLPESLERIDYGAFYNCTSLESATINSKTAKCEGQIFGFDEGKKTKGLSLYCYHYQNSGQVTPISIYLNKAKNAKNNYLSNYSFIENQILKERANKLSVANQMDIRVTGEYYPETDLYDIKYFGIDGCFATSFMMIIQRYALINDYMPSKDSKYTVTQVYDLLDEVRENSKWFDPVSRIMFGNASYCFNTYNKNGNGLDVTIEVARFSGTENKKEKIITLLQEHPEGIMVNGHGKRYHAVAVVDYDYKTDKFTVLDPGNVSRSERGFWELIDKSVSCELYGYHIIK